MASVCVCAESAHVHLKKTLVGAPYMRDLKSYLPSFPPPFGVPEVQDGRFWVPGLGVRV